jgi:hypothetical protein
MTRSNRSGVVPDDPDAVLDGLEQDVGEVAAQDLDLGDDAVAPERLDPHGRADPAVVVDVGDAELVDAAGHDLVVDPHAAGDVATGATQVDGLAALPR